MIHTTDKAAQITLSLLKQYGVRKIVVSPGTTNVPISMTVQNDPWFEVYSVVDERSAAYFATGLAYESNEPVVISCTGATASRNYLPGLTEAYYRNIPVIALTSQHHVSDFKDLTPQVTDRSSSQNDIKKISVMLPFIKDHEDVESCEILVNRALITATKRGGGPVHINLPVDSSYPFESGEMNYQARKIQYYDESDMSDSARLLRNELSTKKVGVFIGSHRKFSEQETKAINNFVNSFNIAVFTDHTSSYAGKNKLSTAQVFGVMSSDQKPELIIDIGGVTGDYDAYGALQGIEVWRISEDGEIHDRFRSMTKLFDMGEAIFFNSLTGKTKSKHGYYNNLKMLVADIAQPDMPLSNTYVSGKIASLIPKASNLHLGILNSLRNMNLYELDSTIAASSNVGGFGIDGALSTLIGQSMVNHDKLYFGLIGDLAFFYDMNVLGNRHVGNNLRIVVVNNNQGVEFRLNPVLEEKWGEDTDDLIAAKGHNGSVKAWAESMGFAYLSANTKESFDANITEFCNTSLKGSEQPMIFEVFTNTEDEQIGYDLMRLQ